MERSNRSQYQHSKNREATRLAAEFRNFDFDSRKCEPPPYQLKDTTNTDTIYHKNSMLRGLQIFCLSCHMCPLGRKLLYEHGEEIDPHVFSNMRMEAQFMVVGQNPGFNECKSGIPFIGSAGDNFDKELDTHGFNRCLFYTTNICKCHTQNNIFDGRHKRHAATCAPILALEIQVIKPKLIITLGAHAFDFFAPDKKMADFLGDIIITDYGPVYALYHPSPRNLSNKLRAHKWEKDVALMCKLLRKLRTE